MRILVCGGRGYHDYPKMCQFMSDLTEAQGEPSAIIHGAAFGADRMAGRWAKENGIPVETFPANWIDHGKSAGPIRNAKMLKEGRPDLVVAFPGGSGTAHMVRIAEKAGVKIMKVAP